MKKTRIKGRHTDEGYRVDAFHSDGSHADNEFNTITNVLRMRGHKDRTLIWGIGFFGINTWGRKDTT